MTGNQSQALGSPMDSHLLSQNQPDDKILCVFSAEAALISNYPSVPRKGLNVTPSFSEWMLTWWELPFPGPNEVNQLSLCSQRAEKDSSSTLQRLWYLTGGNGYHFQEHEWREKLAPHCERFQRHSSNPNKRLFSVLRTPREWAEWAQCERVNSSSALSYRSQDIHDQCSRTGAWNQISKERTLHSAVISNWLTFLFRKALL